MLFNSAALLVLAAAARAIQITAPTNTTGWTAGVAQTIKWTSVSTDPTTFDIKLQVPNSAKIETLDVVTKVETSKGEYTFTPTADEVGEQFRISFYGTDSNSGILAQSDYFEIAAGSGAAASSAGASASASATSAATASGASAASDAASKTSAVPVSGAPSGASASAPNAFASSSASASTTPKSGAKALVPSLALVGGSIVALML